MSSNRQVSPRFWTPRMSLYTELIEREILVAMNADGDHDGHKELWSV